MNLSMGDLLLLGCCVLSFLAAGLIAVSVVRIDRFQQASRWFWWLAALLLACIGCLGGSFMLRDAAMPLMLGLLTVAAVALARLTIRRFAVIPTLAFFLPWRVTRCSVHESVPRLLVVSAGQAGKIRTPAMSVCIFDDGPRIELNPN
jgi:hypothetical protein